MTKHVPHQRLTQHYKAGADYAAKNSSSYSQNKQLDEGEKKEKVSVSVCVWSMTVSPQSGHHVRKQNVTTTAMGRQLLHTSPLTFPDFNNHNFPISLINPRVAVTQSTQNTSPPLSPPGWMGPVGSVLGRGSVGGRPQTEITSCLLTGMLQLVVLFWEPDGASVFLSGYHEAQ